MSARTPLKRGPVPDSRSAPRAAERPCAIAAPPRGSVGTIARAAILTVGLLLLLRNVTGPFNGHHDWNSAMYSVFARNHVAWGLGYTKFYCTWGDSATPPAQPQRYLNHPPLIAIWAAIPVALFGDHEWATRLVPIVAALGSTCLLITIISRLHSPTLGLLSGFFYALLPVSAYFGRMLDHLPVVQFFSLLMLHGYLHWTGGYGESSARRRGALWYTVGAVLGIGTGWATLLMAGLIGCWHLASVVRRRGSLSVLIALAVIPALTLTVVVLHIVAAADWDFGIFGPMIFSRTVADDAKTALHWPAWCGRNWGYLTRNVSWVGALAAVAYLAAIPMILRRTARDAALRNVVRDGGAVIPVILLLLQGLIYVLVFRRQSWIHDYWQYLGAPFFAVALAALVMLGQHLLQRFGARVGQAVAVVLLLLPIPFFARSLDWYHSQSEFPSEFIEAFKALAEQVPPRAPVFVSWYYPEESETFGRYVNRWPLPVVAYYSNRPLIPTSDVKRIVANQEGAAAYLLGLVNDPGAAEAMRQLSERFESVMVQRHHCIFLLNRPKPGAPPLTP